MATATYRIGPSDFFTPGDLEADADTLDAQVTALDGHMAGVSSDTLDRWHLWVQSWQSFYSDHFGGYFSSALSSLNDSNRDQLVSFENQFEQWRQQASAQGVTVPGPTVSPSTGSGDSLGKQLSAFADQLGLSGTTLILIVLAIVAATVAWKVWK